MKSIEFALLFLLVTLSLGVALPQAAPSAKKIIGEVQSTAATQVVIKTDGGEVVTVAVDPATTYLRIPPGEKDLQEAAKITLADIGVGDRVLARAKPGSDIAGGAPAGTLVVMSKAAIAQKHEADRAEWLRRGVAATITSVDPAKNEIAVNERTRDGMRLMVVQTSDKTTFRRYAPESVRFADAKPSSFTELRVGDQIRVLGERNEDRTHMKAEAIVSGAFRNFSGTVIAVDGAANEVKVTDLETKKPVTVRLNIDTMVRRMPAQMAQFLAMRSQYRGQGGGPGGPGAGSQQRPAGAAVPPAGGAYEGPAGAPGGGPGGRGGWQGGGGQRTGGGDSQQLLERMPAITVTELKAGDALIIAGSPGSESSRILAIALVAGVEPILTAPRQAGPESVGGAWNFDINIIP